MKTKLLQLVSGFLLTCALLTGTRSEAQLNYTQNFETDQHLWTGYYDTDFSVCNGIGSLQGYFYSYVDEDFPDFFYHYDSTAESPLLGISNGMPATLTYSYKLTDYDENAIPNSPDWGSFVWEYSTTPTGPWTVFQTVGTAQHIASSGCAVKTATFTPPGGSNVYIRYRSIVNQSISVDVNVYLDDITITQAAAPACTGAPAASSAIAALSSICNQQSAALSLSPYYTASGLTYQWQSSTDNVTYTNIAGATANTLNAPQSSSTWYRAIITCTASTSSTTSAPVQVTNSNTNCTLCQVEFTSDVEPISLVNFAGINNVTSAIVDDTPSVQDFTSLPPTLVTKGQSYTMTVQGNTGGSYTNYFKVFIDFNRNGNLNDIGESFFIGTIADSDGADGQQASASILIPANAQTGLTLMRVYKLFGGEPDDACESNSYGQVEDYMLTVQAPGPCTTAAPTAMATQDLCGAATVANLMATGAGIKWYAAATGGTALPSTQAIVSGTTYYASQTVGCESTTRTAVTATVTVVPADNPEDVSSCESYTLPALTNGIYRTAMAGGGTVVAAGTVITETTTLYVYATSGTCSIDNEFVVTITTAVADDPTDVYACGSYILPALSANNAYYTATAGGGTMLAAGTSITETATLYVMSGTATCSDENSFTITIYNAIADNPEDVTSCGPYILPEMTNPGIYTTEANGQGDLLSPGDEITVTSTIYIYAEAGDENVMCTDSNSFVVTILNVEADDMENVTACGQYVLPELTNGNYYTGGSGIGEMLMAGDVITETSTIHIYAQTGTAPNICSVDNAFTVTIINTDVVELDDVDTCSAYILPALESGNYYTGPEGTGSQLAAGDLISETATIYIYNVNENNSECTAQSSFEVVVTPLANPGDITVTIESADELPMFNLYEIDLGVEYEGTITFYASPEDAQSGENALSAEEMATAGTYYATITDGDCTSDPFMVTVDTVLGNGSFDTTAFTFHPNPVSDILNINYSKDIQAVTVYNLLGQEVMVNQVNATSAQINMASLAAGTYLVKVEANNAVKTIKVIKTNR